MNTELGYSQIAEVGETPTAIAAATSGPPSPIVQAAERLVARIEALVNQVSSLRAENASLRREVRDAVALLERAGTAGTDGAAVKKPGRRAAASAGKAHRRRRKKGPKGRATPASVTAEVVRAVLAKKGAATASEIAHEITLAGAPVSGRAIRFLAERAGAETFVSDDGQRRYRL
jgi:hypothetical protein